MPPHLTHDTLTLPCPAKVNLALAVGAPDATDFHPIATWMVALDFADALTLRRLGHDNDDDESDGASRYDLRFADDAPVPGAIDWPLEKDLAYRAHRALEQAAGRALPIELTLRKRIPTGAGLGGGSSDAAGVLWGINELFALGLSDATLRAHAAALGSDVPFLVAALQGETATLATGRGEHLQPTPLRTPMHLVLVLPPLSCATGAVYKAFDASAGAEASVDEARVRQLAERGEARDEELFNDLAGPACDVCPPLADTMKQVAAAVNRRVHVTGSGAALFVLARDRDDARQLAQHITDATTWATVATSTLAHG